MVKAVFDENNPSKEKSFEGNFIWLKMNFLVLIFAVSSIFEKPIKSRKTAIFSGFSWWAEVDSLLNYRKVHWTFLPKTPSNKLHGVFGVRFESPSAKKKH